MKIYGFLFSLLALTITVSCVKPEDNCNRVWEGEGGQYNDKWKGTMTRTTKTMYSRDYTC